MKYCYFIFSLLISPYLTAQTIETDSVEMFDLQNMLRSDLIGADRFGTKEEDRKYQFKDNSIIKTHYWKGQYQTDTIRAEILYEKVVEGVKIKHYWYQDEDSESFYFVINDKVILAFNKPFPYLEYLIRY